MLDPLKPSATMQQLVISFKNAQLSWWLCLNGTDSSLLSLFDLFLLKMMLENIFDLQSNSENDVGRWKDSWLSCNGQVLTSFGNQEMAVL